MTQDLSYDEFQRIYGRYESLTPADAARLFDRAPFRWWVCGGWSTELGPELRRFHEDIEIGIAREDLPTVREWLHDFHLWDVHASNLHYLWPADELPDDHEQIWVRRNAYSPWLMDLMLTPVEGETWFYKRDRRLTMPLSDVLVERDGIPYQRPEVTLLYKAKHRKRKDEADLEAVVPLLSDAEREWLRAAIEMSEPGNPWIDRLS